MPTKTRQKRSELGNPCNVAGGLPPKCTTNLTALAAMETTDLVVERGTLGFVGRQAWAGTAGCGVFVCLPL